MAAKRRCPGTITQPNGRTRPCPQLIPPGARYCPTHAREYEARRGTSTQRGYDYAHRRQAEAYRARVAQGTPLPCWRCGKPITDPNDLDLGHDDHDRSIVRGPEHARGCNRSAAGRSAHA